MNFRNLNAWRRSPQFTSYTIADMFPGLGTASAIFAGYVVVDSIFGNHHSHVSNNHHGKEEHHEKGKENHH